MSSTRKKTNASNSEFRRKLRKWLVAQGTSESDIVELTYHLGDLREAFARADSLLKALPRVDPNSAKGRRHLASLVGELFDHLGPHLRESKRPISALMRRHYRSADARGEL
jgi:hypothetical protein